MERDQEPKGIGKARRGRDEQRIRRYCIHILTPHEKLNHMYCRHVLKWISLQKKPLIFERVLIFCLKNLESSWWKQIAFLLPVFLSLKIPKRSWTTSANLWAVIHRGFRWQPTKWHMSEPTFFHFTKVLWTFGIVKGERVCNSAHLQLLWLCFLGRGTNDHE